MIYSRRHPRRCGGCDGAALMAAATTVCTAKVAGETIESCVQSPDEDGLRSIDREVTKDVNCHLHPVTYATKYPSPVSTVHSIPAPKDGSTTNRTHTLFLSLPALDHSSEYLEVPFSFREAYPSECMYNLVFSLPTRPPDPYELNR